MKILFFISILVITLFAKGKDIIFTGVYPGVDISYLKEKNNPKSDLYYIVLKGILDGKIDLKNNIIKQEDRDYLNNNLYKVSEKLYTSLNKKQIKKSLGKHKFVSIDDLKSSKVNIKNLVFSFMSIDNILTFAEAPKANGDESVPTRVEIYIMTSFYAVDVSTMRLVYTTQFVTPLTQATEHFNKDSYKNLLISNTNHYYDATKEILKRSIKAPSFRKTLDINQHSSTFLFDKNSAVIKSNVSDNLKKAIKNQDEFCFFNSYLLSSKLSKTLPLLPPFLGYKMEKNDMFSDNKYTKQFTKNIDKSLKFVAGKYGFKIDYDANIKKLKVVHNTLKLPEFTFPKSEYVIENNLNALSKVVKKDRAGKQKAFIVASRPVMRFAMGAKKSLGRKKALDKSKKAKEVKYADYTISVIYNVIKDESEIYYYNAFFNLYNKKDKKMQFQNTYNLKCLIENSCMDI